MRISKLISFVICLSCFFLTYCDSRPDKTPSPAPELVAGDSLQNFISYSSDAVVGQTVYVPVYSHIYQYNKNKTFNLTTTLSIRNTDLRHSIVIKKVYYYDSDGNLAHNYLNNAQTIDPLSSTSFVIEEEDLRGGVGLVLWESAAKVNTPIFEAVMISTSQQQGISFVSKGRVIHSLSALSAPSQ